MAETREGAWALVEKGKELWGRVAARRARTASRAEEHAAIEVRVHALEERAAGLEEEAVSSFEVVRSITEQHSQLAEQNARLAETVDALLARTRLLAWACAGAVGVAAVALLAALLA
ncbi:MAG: hypothetical protein ACT4P3_17765 [Betaproteobacteria bacterium]